MDPASETVDGAVSAVAIKLVKGEAGNLGFIEWEAAATTTSLARRGTAVELLLRLLNPRVDLQFLGEAAGGNPGIMKAFIVEKLVSLLP